MINIKSTDRITICGLPGKGKSVLAKYLATIYEKRGLMIYDPLDQYKGFPDECRYVPRSDDLSEFEAICAKVKAQGNMVFLVEECERYLGQGIRLTGSAFEIVNRGRNWGIGIIAVTRRIQAMSKDYFDLCSSIFFFKCGPRSRKYIAEMIGKRELSHIVQLPLYHFLAYSVDDEHSQIGYVNISGTRPHIETKTTRANEKPGEPEVEPKEDVKLGEEEEVAEEQ